MKFYSHLAVLAVLFLIFPPLLSAQAPASDSPPVKKDSVNVEFAPNVNPVLNITRIPNGKITIDGVLDETEWETSAVADNFTEIEPGDNVKPEVETVGYVMYDDDYIYFGFECYDDMKNIRASMIERDRMFSDDWVGPFIDTYSNYKEAFEFYVNPYGIQGDLYWTPNYETSSPDFIFYAETKLHKDKWVAEMKIPFKSLRFPNKQVQEWKVHLLRNRPRNLRQRIYWSSVARDNPNFLGQAGIFKGIEGIKGSNHLEILPYMAGIENAELGSPVNSNSSLDYDNPKMRFGVDLKYGLTSDLTLNGTFNPDFSQVEADAPQIDVNNPFALFFNEKRPFFLDGESVFRTHLNFVYTRSINNPIFASKLTGKIGKKFEVGYMSAYDEGTPFVIPLEDRSFVLQSNKSSLANILRVKYDLGGENHIGALFTDREYSTDSTFTANFTGYSRTLGMDFKFNFLKNFYFRGQLTGFSEREISDTAFFDNQSRFGKEKQYTAAFDGEAYNDVGLYLGINRGSDNYGFWSEYSYDGPATRRGLGFLSRNNYHQGFMYHYYNFYLENDLIRRITPDADLEIRYNTDGIRKKEFVNTGITFEFQNGTRLWGNYRWINNENFRETQLNGVTGWNFGIENFALREIGGGLFYSRGKQIRFENIPFVGEGQGIELWATIRPVDRIVSHFNYNYSDLGRSFGGEMIYAGWIFGNTTTFQFNKNLFVRLVTQYDSFDDSFGFDPLVSYKWNPFTVLYLGTTHRFEQVDDDNTLNGTALKEKSRQIFIKFQYLWQM
jgi:hypothetical protein